MTPTQDQLALIWREVLNTPEVETDSDFFGLGGDSVAVMVMLMRVEETFAIYLDPGVIYEAPTLDQLAVTIERELEAQAVPVT